MANLNGQNIGTNYKGFLNLDSTINTPLDATLRAVTDGMGNSSVLQLSTTQVATLNNLVAGTSATGGFKIENTNTLGYANLAIKNNSLTAQIYFGGATSSTPSLLSFYNPSTNGFAFSEKVSIGTSVAASAMLQVRGAASANSGIFETSAGAEIMTIGVSGGNTIRFLGAIRTDFINDYANGYTLLQYVSGTRISFGSDALRLDPTNFGAIFKGVIRAAALPTTRPATVGDLYQDTAANILANGDKVVGIRQ